jgi:hypothetical protein
MERRSLLKGALSALGALTIGLGTSTSRKSIWDASTDFDVGSTPTETFTLDNNDKYETDEYTITYPEVVRFVEGVPTEKIELSADAKLSEELLEKSMGWIDDINWADPNSRKAAADRISEKMIGDLKGFGINGPFDLIIRDIT